MDREEGKQLVQRNGFQTERKDPIAAQEQHGSAARGGTNGIQDGTGVTPGPWCQPIVLLPPFQSATRRTEAKSIVPSGFAAGGT